jgi:hypothetical protein
VEVDVQVLVVALENLHLEGIHDVLGRERARELPEVVGAGELVLAVEHAAAQHRLVRETRIEALLLRLGARGHHAAHARRIDGHRLFDENVFAGVHAHLQVHGAKMGRFGQKDDIHVALDQLLAGAEARKTMRSVHVDLGSLVLGELFQAKRQLFRK